MTGSGAAAHTLTNGGTSCRRLSAFLSFAPSPEPEKPARNGTRPLPRGSGDDRRSSASLKSVNVTHADLANWLLAKEIGTEADGVGVAAAAEQVGRKLSLRLSTLITPAGSQAILSRALHLARVEFPFLEGVHAGTTPEACFEGLGPPVLDLEAGEAGRGLHTVLRIMLDLLVGFIGEELTLRLVREVWPDLPGGGPRRPANSDGQEARS
jgi:hypothetical protein